MRFGNQLTAWEKAMLQVTRTIAHLRNTHSAFRYGDFLTLKAENSVYAYMRSDMNERLLVVLNKGDVGQSVQLQMPAAYRTLKLVDLVDGSAVQVTKGRARVTVPGIGWRMFRAY
jgi:glycosidase